MLNPQRVHKYLDFDEYIYKSILLQNQLQYSLFPPFLYYYIMGNKFPFLSLTMVDINLLSSYFWFHFLSETSFSSIVLHVYIKKTEIYFCLLLYFISHTHISCLIYHLEFLDTSKYRGILKECT